ncbi:similar to Saccharomyces cerevisiae YOR004W UTP23 Essential nucleolar protein that is a component of the SSU (small subunit) processome involved in 40S ribosomal subunit biogenesis [Maudiozyma saulgeensis]|uniref:U three protein 23 n=1 Tax=Maudiozyma saulgeensis TaxID=1789683 RepID=A0A1X7R6K3_9SACH|nr:similar to Saccharomyces cerevisiae YOR004W UTP23 Essential nucleolar protein that is a component of the SSU (small subunit) processome involved in 40S ribosomal subunit biogenesis [Kazachstania saulgeensis]
MRQKRAKSYRKQLLVYHHTFKFREPYQIIVDDQIVTTSNDSSFNLTKGLQRTLQAEVKVMITQCCMQALYEIGNQDAISMAKQFERRRCNHNPKDPKTPMECIESIVDINGENKHRYIVASQDIQIRRKLRHIPGVPLVHISRSVMVMEPLSDASARVSRRKEVSKLYEGLNNPKPSKEKPAEKESTATESKKPKQRGPRGPKGPNPLSMKKRKRETKADIDSSKNGMKSSLNDKEEGQSGTKRRRRKHSSQTKTSATDNSETKESVSGTNAEPAAETTDNI